MIPEGLRLNFGVNSEINFCSPYKTSKFRRKLIQRPVGYTWNRYLMFIYFVILQIFNYFLLLQAHFLDPLQIFPVPFRFPLYYIAKHPYHKPLILRHIQLFPSLVYLLHSENVCDTLVPRHVGRTKIWQDTN